MTGGDLALRPEAVYLVTGGFGGLGLQVARWLADRGARSLVMVGRSGASDAARTELDALERRGVSLTLHKADVSSESDVASILRHMPEGRPLAGIVHAAGILDDGVIRQQRWSRFQAVMAPKVEGAIHLHRLTAALPLDFFVLFSSAVSTLGAAGQSNYAAANAVLDALAHDRHAQGLPAISINWGPWAELGMAASLDARTQTRYASHGWGRISIATGLEILQSLVTSKSAQVAVLPVDWRAVFAHAPEMRSLPLLAEMRPAAEASDSVATVDRGALRRAPEDEQRGQIESLLCSHLARVLSLRRVDLDADIGKLGLDSLMALEVRHAVDRDLGVTVPVVALLDGSSPRVVALSIVDDFRRGSDVGSPSGDGDTGTAHEAARSRALLERLPDLSDADVDALLASLLAADAARS